MKNEETSQKTTSLNDLIREWQSTMPTPQFTCFGFATGNAIFDGRGAPWPEGSRFDLEQGLYVIESAP